MKKYAFSSITILALCLIAFTSFAVEPDDILGSWLTEGGDSCVEIFRKDDRYFAKITSLREPNFTPGEVEGMDGKPRIDIHNPDESLREQSLIGLELMKNFKFNGKQWVNGRIYDPDNGKTYKCKMTLKEEGILHVRGYIGISALGRTTTWTRPEVFVEQQGEPLSFACPCEDETGESSTQQESTTE
jgi:uncharacterized protein (DUF2147 family)